MRRKLRLELASNGEREWTGVNWCEGKCDEMMKRLDKSEIQVECGRWKRYYRSYAPFEIIDSIDCMRKCCSDLRRGRDSKRWMWRLVQVPVQERCAH